MVDWKFEPYVTFNKLLPVEYATVAFAMEQSRPNTFGASTPLKAKSCDLMDPPIDKRFKGRSVCVDPNLLKSGYLKNIRIYTVFCRDYGRYDALKHLKDQVTCSDDPDITNF